MNFPHSLVLLTRDSGAQDAEGFPVEGTPVETTFKGWLQPSAQQRRITAAAAARTAETSEEEGLAFSSHILFAPIAMKAVMRKNDRVRKDPPDGLYYVLANDPQDAAGRAHHVEVDLVEYRYAGAA